MIDLEEWVVEMEAAQKALPIALEIAVKETAEIMAAHARAFIGNQQQAVSVTSPLPYYLGPWEPLAARTLDDKFRLGINKEDGAPLFRTGEMQNSIRGVADGLTGIVGSDDPVALWQEMGTAKIPPRPFLARAVIEGLPILELRLNAVAVSILKPLRQGGTL